MTDRFLRVVRANLNDVLEQIREIEDEGGLGAKFEEMLRQRGQWEEEDEPRREPRKPRAESEKTLRDYYANLEVPYGSDLETVKKSYRRLMKEYHPDRYSGDPEMQELATELTQELTRAYEAIKNHLESRR
jgi:DnaJ-domain-containing protein 1